MGDLDVTEHMDGRLGARGIGGVPAPLAEIAWANGMARGPQDRVVGRVFRFRQDSVLRFDVRNAA